MTGRKAQVATEYLLITAFVLIAVTIIFTYSYVTNTQSIKVEQASLALDKLTNKADLVYALGPDNNQFVDVTLPRDVISLNDLTICDGGTLDYDADCSATGETVQRGAIEIKVGLLGGSSALRRPAKGEIELDIFYDPDTTKNPELCKQKDLIETNVCTEVDEGTYRVKVYWCDPATSDAICLKRA